MAYVVVLETSLTPLQHGISSLSEVTVKYYAGTWVNPLLFAVHERIQLFYFHIIAGNQLFFSAVRVDEAM